MATTGKFVAMINTPGYLPDSVDLPTFDTAKEAWLYLAEERRRAEDEAADYVTHNVTVIDAATGEPDYEDTISTYSQTVLELERRADMTMPGVQGIGSDPYNFVGTIYGKTPGYDSTESDDDLGVAYTVDYADEEDTEY